jgi:hypothetical protein
LFKVAEEMFFFLFSFFPNWAFFKSGNTEF